MNFQVLHMLTLRLVQDCQRYWTVGGVLRNVPPGSGRRKSRSAASRDKRKQHSGALSNGTSAVQKPDSNAGSSEPNLPEQLMSSNPLASVLMNNLGLSFGDGGASKQHVPVNTAHPAGTAAVRACQLPLCRAQLPS